jgi:hypothetical protein
MVETGRQIEILNRVVRDLVCTGLDGDRSPALSRQKKRAK